MRLTAHDFEAFCGCDPCALVVSLISFTRGHEAVGVVMHRVCARHHGVLDFDFTGTLSQILVLHKSYICHTRNKDMSFCLYYAAPAPRKKALPHSHFSSSTPLPNPSTTTAPQATSILSKHVYYQSQ
jgi:hypothetical protein